MTNQTVGENGVHVAGSAITPNWTPQYGTARETSNNRYAYVTYVDPNATYEYKFLNGDFWGTDESAPAPCGASGNRQVVVASDDVIADAFCFGTCELCAPQTEVTFKVNLTQQGGGNPEGVSVAGAFQGWSPGTTLMTDDNADGIYEVTLMMDQGTYEYKFLNGLAWGTDEEIPCLCAVNNNREIVVGVDPVTVEFCFAQCEVSECIDVSGVVDMTFRVNMNAETVSPEGVYVIGNFTTPPFQAGAIQMTDDDSDGIYEASAPVTGIVELKYKFINGDVNTPANEESADLATAGCGCSNGFGGYNRTHILTGVDEVLTAFVFNSCSDLVSTSNIELGRVNIFPNPTDGLTYIEIENPNRHNLRMNIVDVTGKVVRENVLVNNNRVEINAGQLAPGLYLLNVTNENSERAVYKLMVR
jgi:hypothetical protein